MATISNTLETIMTLKGTDTVISGLEQAAARVLKMAEAQDQAAKAQKGLNEAQVQFNAGLTAILAPLTGMINELKSSVGFLFLNIAGFEGLAASEGLAAAATITLEAALAVLESPLVIIAAVLATLTAGFFVAAKGLSAFSESEDTIGRLAIRMQHLGNVFPIKQLTEFSSKLGDQLGIDDELIAKLGAMAAGFGLTRQQIEKALPVVLDVAVANKLDPEQVLQKIFRASRGRTQGLISLGIDPKKIQGDVHDVNNLLNQIGQQFQGTAAAFRNTLPGSIEAFKVAVGNLFEAIGRFISPAVVPLLNAFTRSIQMATQLLDRIANFLHLPTSADLGAQVGGKGADLALKGDPEQTEALNKIADNTSKTADAIIKNVLGGPGTIAKQAFTWRDAQMAFKI